MSEKKRVYLDWAAATPLLPEAKAAMEPYWSEEFANASSIHQEGVRARLAVESAREKIAKTLQVKPEFVTFTGGGTEGNNLSILGVVEYLRLSGRAYGDISIITTKIEHPSVSKVFEYLSSLGVTVKYVTVSEEGKIDLNHLKELVDEKTVLFSASYANSEIGVVQSLRLIKKVLREAEEKFGSTIIFHVDAAQAPLWLSCQFDQTNADLLVLDAAKCCGPKGVGVLVRSKRVKLSPVLFGGGQEQGLRSGTENTAGIVGAAVAIEWAQNNWRERAKSVSVIRNQGIDLLLQNVSGVVLNGPTGEDRLANNINISIPGLDTEFTTIVLDSKGFAVSTKSACSGAGGGESAVVKTTTNDHARATSTLRITIGPDTTIKDIENLTTVLNVHLSHKD